MYQLTAWFILTEIKQRAVAQHALIQAINFNGNNYVAWTNLGTLYLIVGDVKLANKAFSAAQRCDHDYTRCWVGQVSFFFFFKDKSQVSCEMKIHI